MKIITQNKQKAQAQVLLPSNDLNSEISFFNNIGFLLDQIFPSDDPAVAIMSGHGIHIRIDKNISCAPPIIHLLTDQIEFDQNQLKAPGGTQIIILPKAYKLEQPLTQHKFEVRRLKDGASWIIGRAGMLYRDLIPNRLGGSIIASHIHIPEGGPVPDMVHYHTIGFQLIFCYKGWVKLVYEDQGPAFTLHAGECVTQPPEIRHRVLEASDNLEVIEIGVPAEHMTTIDHDMILPTESFRPNRKFQGQLFCHHQLKDVKWRPWRIDGFECCDTGINKATNNMASVQIVRPKDFQQKAQTSSHNSDILFTFVMQGQLALKAEHQSSQFLEAGDAFVIPPFLNHQLSHPSKDLELLEVALPGNFETIIG